MRCARPGPKVLGNGRALCQGDEARAVVCSGTCWVLGECCCRVWTHMSRKIHKMENWKLALLPGSLAHEPYQVERRGDTSWNVPLASPITVPVWFPESIEEAQGKPLRHPTWRGESLQTGTTYGSGQPKEPQSTRACLSLSLCAMVRQREKKGCVCYWRKSAIYVSLRKVTASPRSTPCTVNTKGGQRAHSLEFSELFYHGVSCGTSIA